MEQGGSGGVGKGWRGTDGFGGGVGIGEANKRREMSG